MNWWFVALLAVLFVCYAATGEAVVRIARWDALRDELWARLVRDDVNVDEHKNPPLTRGELLVCRWGWPLVVACILVAVDRGGFERDLPS